jgi:hypothetical protein
MIYEDREFGLLVNTLFDRRGKDRNGDTCRLTGYSPFDGKEEIRYMSEKHPECPLYNPLNCKEYYNPKLCAFVRKDKVCLKKKKPKAKSKKKA